MISRRDALALGALGLLVAGCGSKSDGGEQEWSYTDARGKKITLPKTPKRLVAYAGVVGALWDYGVRFAGVWGPHSPVKGKPNPQSGDAKFDGVESIGEKYGDFNIEKLISLKPDLALEVSYIKGEPFYIPKDALGKIEQAVPVALIDTSPTRDLPKTLDAFVDLAAKLGAPDVQKIADEARKDFAKASDEFRAIVKANPKLRVVTVSGAENGIYISNPDMLLDLQYFRSLGLNITKPTSTTNGGYFQQLSWEEVGRYPADVIFYDAREQSMDAAQLRTHPTFRDLPASKANQLIAFNTEVPFSYQQNTKLLRDIGAQLKKCRKVT